jgi:hypothetical protein
MLFKPSTHEKMESIAVSVTLASPITLKPGSKLVIELHDVTVQDARSTRVARRVLDLAPGENFSGVRGVDLGYEKFSPGRDLSIRAFLDMDGDLRAGPGDFTTTQAYPIEPGRSQISVELRSI